MNRYIRELFYKSIYDKLTDYIIRNQIYKDKKKMKDLTNKKWTEEKFKFYNSLLYYSNEVKE